MYKLFRFLVVFILLFAVHSYSEATTLSPGEIYFKVNNAGGGSTPARTIYIGMLCLNLESTENIAKVGIGKGEQDLGPLAHTYKDTVFWFSVNKKDICGEPDYSIDRYPFFIIEDDKSKVNVKKKTIHISENRTSASIKPSDVQKLAGAKIVTFNFYNAGGDLFTVEVPKDLREKWNEISKHDIDYLIEHNQ